VRDGGEKAARRILELIENEAKLGAPVVVDPNVTSR
jgi:hypothetical protein